MTVVILSLLAATAFAFGNVLQQKGTLEASASGDDPHFFVQILRRPVWLAGGALQMSGWILQAAALDRGSLVVVQSLSSQSLVIALPLGARFTNQVVSRRVIIGAVAMLLGIVLFLSVGSPEGGTTHPTTADWVSAGIGGILIVVVLARYGGHRAGASRALLFGSAAGIAFALQASVTKEFMTIIGSGLDVIVTSWQAYALAATAVAGFVLQQSALKTGVLAPAMASSNAVTLFASVVFGITIFGEKLSGGNGQLIPALLGLGAALVGVVLLAGTKPPQASTPVPFADTSPPAGVGPEPGP